MTIIEDFRNELLPLLTKISTEPIPQDDERCFKTIFDEKGSLFFSNEIESYYRKTLRILRLMVNRSSKLISDKALESKLDNFILKLKYSPNQEDVKNEIDRHIVAFIQSLKKLKSEKFLFMVPIMNLKIEGDIQIGDSSIVTLTEQLFESLEKTHSLKFSFGQKNYCEPIKDLPATNGTETYAIVTVEAPDSDKALELAMQKAETCLNILRVYSSNWNFVLRNEFKKSLGQRLIKANLDKKLYGECNSSVNLVSNHFPAILAKDGIEKFNLNIRPIIDSLLSKTEDELTNLQAGLLTAILWFGSAAKENDKNMKFVKSIMALETLLVPNGEERESVLLSPKILPQ